MSTFDNHTPAPKAPQAEPLGGASGAAPLTSPDTTAGAQVITFGCRLNAYESQVIERHANAAGLGSVTVVNTCAVTSEATRQARQAIRRLKRDHPERDIIVTGCAAQIDPEMFRTMPEVGAVIGNNEKLQAASYNALALKGLESATVNDIFSVQETAGHMLDGFGDRARAFVQIQNGCNHRCTFCIIPYGRGNSRSVPMGESVNQIKRLVGEGYKEVVLTGVDITSYGDDLPGTPSLGTLVQKILTLVPDLPRLRISSIDSIEVDEALFDAVSSEMRVMPHLHLSLQAGHNMILKRMKRRHSREESIAFAQKLRAVRPDIVFGADIIAGFPTEDEEMFQASLDLVDDAGLTWLHVFPYSEREGTPAARMPQVAKAIRKERAERLRRKGSERVAQLLRERSNTEARVLIERVGDNGIAYGHSEHFIPVEIAPTQGRPLTSGDLVRVRLACTPNSEDIMFGTAIS